MTLSAQANPAQTAHGMKIFAGQATQDLGGRIALAYGDPLGDSSLLRFSDGEFQPIINESVRGCDVFLVQSTYAPADNLMELLLMIDACKRASAHYITAVIPYFGLARQDRKDKPRVPIGARLVADMLGAAGVTRVMTMDLHAPQIQGFFNVPFDHLDASTIFVPYVKSLQLDQVAIAAPDMGAAARAKFFASHLDCPIIVCDKTRARANVVAKIQVIGEVKGKNVVIVDDLVDTAGTIAMVADQLMRKGAASVRAVCTHGVLSGEAIERIANSALTELVVTDTIPLRRESTPKIKVLSVAELFAQSIRSVREFSSISHLFEVKVKSN
ncbi:MAG: ribose-phosphate pyrophosphokinase [Sphingobacteriia bacterium]|jgi:ribose-phosphate pyrophosphokinase|nr:ribose-phosphate pyrophosphokinase [Sphingobacteriia bacterium]